MIDRLDQEIRGPNVVRCGRLEPLFQDRKKKRETRRKKRCASPTPPESRKNCDGKEKHTHMECRHENVIECGDARKQRDG